MREREIDRRRFLSHLAGGAALAATHGRASAAPSPEWDQTVAAARKEGKVAVNTFTGQGYGRVLKLFAQAHPEIKVDHTNLEPVDFSPRIINERKAGVYTWDVATMPTSTALQVLRPAGVFDPIRPAIITADAKNDANWRGGFEAGFLDKDKRLAYAFTLVRAAGTFVNADRVKDGELKSVKDLLDPRWKGKIAISDPRVIGSTFWPLTIARLKVGDDVMKQLLVDQEPVLSRDRNQLTEFMVRGRYPIAIGLNALALQDFQAKGVGKNIKTILLLEMDYQSSGSLVWLINKAPHPNAAKVLINWLLTKDAQIAYAKELQTNSRFVGVEPGDPHAVVPMGLKLQQVDAEDLLPELIKTQDLSKQLIK
ncbi:MAG TPA: extracellular solute-binding protein [Candidatus Acidoferrum sp.]|nr:extracellular solute-binding protein [Candidatus Acidoferrum sp.]